VDVFQEVGRAVHPRAGTKVCPLNSPGKISST
jgi:hypothetical protein